MRLSRLLRRAIVRTSAWPSISRIGYLHVRQSAAHQAIPPLERAVALSQNANNLAFGLLAPHLALAYAMAGRAADALAVLGQFGGNPPSVGRRHLLAGYEEAHRLARRGLR